jgi:membrane associated rhomboid family serine protease
LSLDQPPAQRPIPGFWLILVVNVAVFALLAFAEGNTSIGARSIILWGGLLPQPYMAEEPWRYLSAGFLHFSLVHIVTNMICLLAWGVPLERGLGTMRFLVLFLASILGGSFLSVAMHQGPFVGAGASGGTSGLLGALLGLWFLKRIGVPASFFVINIGLNVAVAIFAPGVDWQAHLGGFLVGLALGMLLAPPRRR